MPNNLQDSDIEHLKPFFKERFDKDNTVQEATNLKYMGDVKKVLESECKNPSPDFVRHCIQDLHSGPKTQGVVTRFTSIVKQAFNQLIADEVNYRLKIVFEGDKAIDDTDEGQEPQAEAHEDNGKAGNKDARIVTTEEEMAAVDIIKEMLADTIDPDRIVMRDQITYCGVLLDDNNRRSICRLHFDRSPKLITLFSKDEETGKRVETKVEIDGIEALRKYKEALLAACALYIEMPKKRSENSE